MRKTWILVADAHQAQIWSYSAREQPHLINTIKPALAHKFERDINSDRPGRAYSTADGRHAAIEPHESHLKHERDQFARDVASQFQKAAAADNIDRLAVIAPAKMLGLIRDHLKLNTGIEVVADQAKDLMKSSEEDIKEHIRVLLGLK